jgi:hypothetical protein
MSFFIANERDPYNSGEANQCTGKRRRQVGRRDEHHAAKLKDKELEKNQQQQQAAKPASQYKFCIQFTMFYTDQRHMTAF